MQRSLGWLARLVLTCSSLLLVVTPRLRIIPSFSSLPVRLSARVGPIIRALAVWAGNPSWDKRLGWTNELGAVPKTSELNFAALLFNRHAGIVTLKFSARDSALTPLRELRDVPAGCLHRPTPDAWRSVTSLVAVSGGQSLQRPTGERRTVGQIYSPSWPAMRPSNMSTALGPLGSAASERSHRSLPLSQVAGILHLIHL